MTFQLFEYQFNFPSRSVQACYVLCSQYFNWNIGQIGVIFPRFLIESTYQPESPIHHALLPPVLSTLEFDLHFHIQDFSLQKRKDVSQPLPHDIYRVTSPFTIHGNNQRIGVPFQPANKIAAIAVDSVEEEVLEVSEIEEQDAALEPWSQPKYFCLCCPFRVYPDGFRTIGNRTNDT